MRNLPVHWFEGMFLRPQHFQAADRYWQETLAAAQQWDRHHNYGLFYIEVNREALGNFQFQVAGCEARLRDGTLIRLASGQADQRLDLKPVFAHASETIVYLAIPKLAMGRANVATHVADESSRYSEQTLPTQDESRGGGEQEVQFRRLNVRLLSSADDHSGFETLPIARVKRAGTDEATPEIDAQFIPPLVRTDAWPALSLEIVRAIYDIVGEKIEVLSQRVTHRRMSLSSQQPGDLDDMLLLMALNEASAALRCLAFVEGLHPFDAYLELCRIVGRLSIFDDRRRVDEIPVYDHDDLGGIFTWIKLRIEQLLGARKKLQYEQRYFVGAERGMQVSIEPDWFRPNWRWYVGVNGTNISDAECRELLRPGKLDWKMGSSQQIELIFRHGLPGIEQKELPRPPRELPPHDWVYYQVQRDNSAWKDVLASQTLALRFKEDLIGNLNKLTGERRLEVVLPEKRAVLEFALFAVPQSDK